MSRVDMASAPAATIGSVVELDSLLRQLATGTLSETNVATSVYWMPRARNSSLMASRVPLSAISPDAPVCHGRRCTGNAETRKTLSRLSW